MKVIKYMFGADSKQYESTVERIKKTTHEMTRNVESQFKKVGGAIAGYLSFTAIKGAIDNAIKYFDNLAHKAEQLGVSASFVQVFEHAMRSVGGSSQQADKAISDFGKKIGEAMSGSGELAQILDRLGIALYTADGAARPLTSIMGDYANAIASAVTPQEKLYLSGKAFGEEAGPKMVEVLKGGAAGMNEMITAFQKAHPEFETTAKRLSAASQSLEDMRTKITIFVGETVGYWLDKFGTMSDAILEFKRLWGDVWFGIAGVFASTVKTLTGGLVDFTDKVLELRIKFDGWLVEGHQKTMQANAEQKGAVESVTAAVNDQVSAIGEITSATNEAATAAKEYAKEQNENAKRVRAALASEVEANKEINRQKDRQFQSDYGIIDRLYKQGFELQEIVNKYPRLLEAAQAYSNLTGDTVTEAEKLTKEIEAATDATNDLADAAGKVDYPTGPTGGYSGGGGGQPGTSTGNIGTPSEDWRTRDGLANTGSSGSGVTGVFAGQYEDLSSMSVAEMLRIADELEETLKGINKNVGGSGITGPTGGLGLDKIYADTIKQILDNINKELYYRAKEEAGSKGGLIPTAGFMSPEKYFEKLDDFIEKLYEKETEKDGAMKQTQQAAQTQTEATKKLQNALERFSSSLERSQSSRFGVSLRP